MRTVSSQQTHTPLRAAQVSVLSCIMLAGGCGRAILSCDDAVLNRDGSMALRAFVERKAMKGVRADIEGHPVRFHVNGTQIGQVETDNDGIATLMHQVQGTPPSSYAAETVIDGQTLRDERPVFRLRPEPRVAIIVDIDGTVCDTSRSGATFGSRDTRSKPIEDSTLVIHKLIATYDVVFLTGRPRILLDKTRLWVKDHEFPDVPLFAAPGLREAMKPGEFKSQIIARARQRFPEVLVGIGDLATDAYAYGANGMLAIIVGQEPDEDYGGHAIQIASWKLLDRFFEANQEILTDPDRLRKIIQEGGMLNMPVVPWRY